MATTDPIPERRRFSLRLPRPRWIGLAINVPIVVAILAGSSSAQRNVDASDGQKARRKNLVEALRTRFECGPTADRAAQQLAVLPPDESLSSAIVSNILRRDEPKALGKFVPASFVAAIASQRRFAVPELIRTLRTEKLSDRDFWIVICSLGRMGPIASEARAVLREKLNDEASPVRFRASLRAVLANTGEWMDDIAQRIDNDLTPPGPGRDYYLHVMSRIHPRGKWLDERVAGRFLAVLRDPEFIDASTYSNAFQQSVIALCTAEFDDKTRDSFVEPLESALDLAFERESLAAIEIAMALSRLRPQRSRPVLQQLFRRLPSLKPQGDVLPFAIHQSETAYLVVNDDIAKVLAELTSSEDAEISERVAIYFTLCGLAARAAVPTLLDCSKNNPVEGRRSNAAEALEWIADYSDVENIESAARAEASKRVSEGLLRAVKSLRQFD